MSSKESIPVNSSPACDAVLKRMLATPPDPKVKAKTADKKAAK